MSKNALKKWIALLAAAAILIGITPVPTVKAADETWLNLGDGNYLLNGTDIKAEISGDTIHVSGNGAIPDYDERTLSKRPWHHSTCKKLVIDNTITSVGTYAFASLPQLEHITFSSTTFLADKSSFAGIAYAPIFRILGYSETVTYIGTIPYSSLDSIKTFAQKNYNDASFLLDHSYMVPLFQNSTNPTISNVYCAYDENAPWEDAATDYNGNQYTQFAELLDSSSDGYLTLRAEKLYADKSVYELFSTVIGDNTFAYTFSMEMQRNDIVSVTRTLEPMFYRITLPDEFIAAGRTFKIISTGQGNVEVLDDLDFNDTTVTFSIKIPQAVFAVVYQ